MMRSFILKAGERKLGEVSCKGVVADKPVGQGGGEMKQQTNHLSVRTVHSSSSFAGSTTRPESNLTGEGTELTSKDTTLQPSNNKGGSPPKPSSPTKPPRGSPRGSSGYSNSTTSHLPTTLLATGSVDTGSLALHTIPSSPTFIKAKEVLDFKPPTLGRDAFFANGPLNAIAASPNQEQVAVAGREVLKILDITTEEIVESLNLRVAYRQNLNFSSADVDWGVGYCRDRLATATTSGSVVVWDLNKSGHKIERLITEHTRAVHRVKFHPTTGTTLFSASQDGTIKAWDVRTKDPARMTLYPKAEAVRDFRFNPLHPEEFVAAFDNGSIQMWDIRQPGQYLKKLTAHSGPTLAVDWHHDGRTVASGGRDKLIKIWDMKSDSRKPTGLIQTIAPVAAVRWRPHHGYQIASTSLSTDYGINVWDTHRPFIPRFSVIGHSNVTTDIFWAGQDVLWSSSKDQHFLRRRLDRGESQGAKEPILYLPTSGLSWNGFGDLGFVVDRPSPTSSLPRPSPSIDPRAERRRALASKLNLSSSFDKNFRISPTQTGGILHLPAFDYPTFAFLALNYSLDSQDPVVATETNFRVAYEAGHFRTAQTWKIIQLICCKTVTLKEPSKDTLHPTSKSNLKDAIGLGIPVPTVHPAFTKTAGEPGFKQNPTSGSSLQSYPRPAQVETDEALELDEWLEGIQIYDASSDTSDDVRPQPRLSSNTTPGRKIEPSVDPSTRVSVSPLSLSDSDDGSSTPSSAHNSPNLVPGQFPHDWDPSQLVKDLLVYYADEGDVQMCSTIALILGKRLHLPIQQSQPWVYSYIELLRRFKLWEPATAILNRCQLPELTSQNQESTTFYTLCPHCHRPLLASSDVLFEGYWGCSRCMRHVHPCGICHQLVKGMYAWCQGCGHGGHLDCLQAWFHPIHSPPPCPTGCGHNCSLILS